MSDTKHTQGEKLSISGEVFKTSEYGIYKLHIKDSINKIRATVFGKTKEEAEANAKRIVKCVNMHDDLIDIIKNLYGAYVAKDFISEKEETEILKLLKQSEQK